MSNGWDAGANSADWDPDVAAGGGGSAADSGYPETKDDGTGTGTGEPVDPWQGSGRNGGLPSEQAVTQGPASEPSAVVVASAAVGGGVGGGGATASAPAIAGAPNGRRHTMAFEIARVERSGKSVPPSLQKAERVWELSRPRYVESSDDSAGGARRVRVPPGKERRDAVPYSVWGTGFAQMGDFGLDVGMYFVTISQLAGAVLFYAALCIVAMVHFSSDGYSGAQVRRLPFGGPLVFCAPNEGQRDSKQCGVM